jgi:hypothetical protein
MNAAVALSGALPVVPNAPVAARSAPVVATAALAFRSSTVQRAVRSDRYAPFFLEQPIGPGSNVNSAAATAAMTAAMAPCGLGVPV